MGLTFKENVNDSRHSGASAVIHALREYGISLYGCDPHLDDMRISREFGILPTTVEQLPAHVAGIVHLVNHDAFKQHTLAHLRARCDEKPFLFDLKRAYDKREAGKNGFLYLHL
jgi:UDP-N-acetyl-D-mannosaminuronate dehydrogenase